MKEHSAPGVAELVMDILSISPDVIYKRIYYAWNIIKADPDDNKFFDAAVVGNADFLVTSDAHFNEALNIIFPRVNIISAEYFLAFLCDLKK
ncbi:MAG: hypothetical protein QM763_19080 [Agriterribacter sp.]